MPDMDRLEALYAWAAEQDALRRAGLPSHWDQGNWIVWGTDCGTACCIAGKVALEDGGQPLDRSGALSEFVILMDGEVTEIDAHAERVLGLTRDQASALFEGDNDLADLRVVIDAVGRGVDGDELWNLVDTERERRSL